MLYDLSWLNDGEQFPPETEVNRINAYDRYAKLFDIAPFEEFEEIADRLIVNFDAYFDIPLLLGFQRLSTIKLSDMVIGAPPSITVNDNDSMTDVISDIRDQTDFDSKLYLALIDYSRYGVAVFRLFNDDEVVEDRGNFAVWNPCEWFPILKKDGTKRIDKHVIAWRVNMGSDLNPDWYLKVQIHPITGGSYESREYQMDPSGQYVSKLISHKITSTGDMPCLVQHISNLPSTTNVYGTSDYKIMNELVFKATERMRQILHILDKHADPSMTGPATMLQTNPNTGELEFKTSQFYAVSPGEEHPEYMTWDGQLEAAFKALEQLLNLIYVMSEMGEAMMGKTDGTGQAISGTAMRYKMVAPLEKARRVSNSFTLPLKKLMATLAQISTGKAMRYQDINVIWEDSLPKDPREIAELTRLQTGAPQILPLRHALMENYDMDSADATHYIDEIKADQEMWGELSAKESEPRPGEVGNPSAPPNPNKKGSEKTPHKTGTASSENQREDIR